MAANNQLRKQRTRQHVIADQGVNYVERFIFDAGHTVLRTEKDYGYDLILSTFDEQGYAEPGVAFLQLKASESLARSGGAYVFDLEVRDYHLWMRERMPATGGEPLSRGTPMTKITYGRLDQMLRSLGFAVRLEKGDALQGDARVYQHAQTGGLFILPVCPDQETVLPGHLDAVRATLDNFGIPHARRSRRRRVDAIVDERSSLQQEDALARIACAAVCTFSVGLLHELARHL